MIPATALIDSAADKAERAAAHNESLYGSHGRVDTDDPVTRQRTVLERPAIRASGTGVYEQRDRWPRPIRQSQTTKFPIRRGESQKENEPADVLVTVVPGSAIVELIPERHAEWSAKHCSCVLKVCRAVFTRQRPFLLKGPEELRPMTQGDIAGDTGLHYSTVGRSVRDLTAKTPHGQVRISDLFSARIETESGSATSSRAVQELMKQLIAVESSDAPLSDDDISHALQNRGIRVKRRTVSKYRQKLGIPNKTARWENKLTGRTA